VTSNPSPASCGGWTGRNSNAFTITTHPRGSSGKCGPPPHEEALGQVAQKTRRLAPRLQVSGQDLGPISACSGKGGVAPGWAISRVGFVVTNLSLPGEGVTHFYNGRARPSSGSRGQVRPELDAALVAQVHS
jgi:hypothetical protein